MSAIDPTNIAIGSNIQPSDFKQFAEVFTGGRTDQVISLKGPKNSLTSVGCRVYQNTNKAITTGVLTPLTFDSESFDTDTMHSTSSNQERIVVQTAGIYWIMAQVRWQTMGAGTMTVLAMSQTLLSASTVWIATTAIPVTAAINSRQQVSALAYFQATEYAVLNVYHDFGGDRNVNAGVGETWLGAVRVG